VHGQLGANLLDQPLLHRSTPGGFELAEQFFDGSMVRLQQGDGIHLGFCWHEVLRCLSSAVTRLQSANLDT